MNRFLLAPGLFLLLLVPGCGPSAEERANLVVQSLTEQAQTFLQSGLIDEAERCLEKAIATPEATDTEAAQALMKEIEQTKYQRAWKKAEEELAPSFDEAIAKLESGSQEEAVTLIETITKESTGAKADCARGFLEPLRAVLDANRAKKFWATFDIAQLEKFEESGTLPEKIWVKRPGDSPPRPAFLEAWKKTLRAGLADAIRRKKEEAANAVPQSPQGSLATNLTVPMEEISNHPEKWFGKRVFFSNAWVYGGIKRDAEHGYTVSVISPNDTRFPAKATGEDMLFIVPRRIADGINALVGGDSKIEVKIYAKIERGKVMRLEGPQVFPRASIYWIGILANGKVQKIL